MARFGQKKKDTGKDLEWAFMGIQVQCLAVHFVIFKNNLNGFWEFDGLLC
jgi:hypothetical protein